MSILDDPNAMAAFAALDKLESVDVGMLDADPLLAARLRYTLQRGAVGISVDADELLGLELSADEISDLSQAWIDGASAFEASGRRHGLRLQLESDESTDPQLIAALKDARDVDTITLVDRNLSGPDRWGWPLDVKSLGASATAGIQNYYHQQLLRREPGDSSDLLIIDALEDVLSSPPQSVSAGFVLAFADDESLLTAETVRRLNQSIGFRAAAIIMRPNNPDNFIHIFLDNLSHNSPLDVAVTHSVEYQSPHIIVGDPAFLNASRVTVASVLLEDEVELQFSRGVIGEEQFGEMAREFEALPGAESGPWDSESGEASMTADRTAPIMEEVEIMAAAPYDRIRPQERFLQAQVFDTSSQDPMQRTMSFEAGAAHEIHVRIGPSSMDWISAHQTFPDHQLPPDDVRATVVLQAPQILAESMAKEIRIGPTGTSTVAKFAVSVPAGIEKVDATMLVIVEGKQLQAATLSGPVTTGEITTDANGIEFIRGTPSDTDLNHQKPCDLTIWKNGAELEVTIFDPAAGPDDPSNRPLHPSLAGVDTAVDSIREQLFDAAVKMEQQETGIEAAGLETIRKLAEQGVFLRKKLIDDALLSRIRRVYVSSPYSSDFFPVEFFYDHVMPDEDAALCPEFKQSVAPGCSPNCKAAAGDKKFVCPSGFWSLSKVIERQVRPIDRQDSRQPESSGRNPVLQPSTEIIFSASNEVNADNPEEIAETIQAMQQLAPVHQAKSWDDWVSLVESHYPSLLITLPHNVESTPFNMLQIAESDKLALHRIGPEYLRPANTQVGPTLLLLGCNTANTNVEYQDFVNEMRSAGAALVVATLTYVLGKRAARVARVFVTQMWATGGDMTFGQLLRRVRARMLVEDNIMGLAITAFGDADWRFRLGGQWDAER